MRRTPRFAAVQVCAVATLALLAVYYVLRFTASRCTGLQCEWYIAPSLLLPLLILVMVALTGVLAISAALRGVKDNGGGAWRALLVVCTLLGVAGPVVSLAIFRDSPDILVPLATVLFLLVPISALSYAASPQTEPK